MLKKVCVMGILLLFASGSASPAAEADATVSVRIAKTKRWIEPFGTVSPARGNAHVIVRLLKERDDRFRVVAKKRKPVADDGTFRVRFERPRRGECRVDVRVAGTDARDREFFPCYIPGFPAGRASLASLSTTTEIDVLIADSNPNRAYGLMYRPRMRSDLGMAFLWDQDTSGGFWMKNTLIPLSIAFFDSEGLILRILDMEPCAEEPCHVYDPEVTYRGALEVNQGAFQEWGISEGDMITVQEDQ